MKLKIFLKRFDSMNYNEKINHNRGVGLHRKPGKRSDLKDFAVLCSSNFVLGNHLLLLKAKEAEKFLEKQIEPTT